MKTPCWNIYSILTILLLLAACQESIVDMDGFEKKPFMLQASIGKPATRALVDEDKSYKFFSQGDQIGFYSEGGNMDAGNAGFENFPMDFAWGDGNGVGGTFIGNDMNVNQNFLGRSFAYYPYTPDVENGMEIRDSEGHCMDLLIAPQMNYIDGAGYVATFYHGFAMLMIQGGEGFEHFLDDLANNPVKVKINKPIKKVAFTEGTGTDYLKNLEYLGPDENDTHDEEYYRTFTGQIGRWVERSTEIRVEGNDTTYITTEKVHAEKVYCVIIPSAWWNMYKGEAISVRSIEVTDDLGNRQVIYPSKNYTDSNPSATPGIYPQAGMRYPLTLKMDGLTPTIYPHDIILWNEGADDIEIGTKMDAGINDVIDFENWMLDYNAYINGELTNEQLLEKGYGSLEQQANGKLKWHFTLNTDLDFTGSDIGNKVGVILSTLTDIFDGQGHTLKNLTLSNPNKEKAGFVGVIKDGGMVKNLKIENLVISEGTDYAGGIAAIIEDGSVTNCSISSLSVVCNGKAGGIAGIVANGEIKNCTVQGFMICTGTTASKIVGESAGSSVLLENNNTTNLMFGLYE